MNWYGKSIISMALEPGMWATDPSPHRLQEHQEVVYSPYGRVKQNVDRSELESYYPGVHLTDSFELAAAYANSKSNSNEDPPVVIELYDEGFDRMPDADAMKAVGIIQFVVRDKSKEFNKILSRKSSDESKRAAIIRLLTSDMEMAGERFQEDFPTPVDDIFERERPLTEQAIIGYLEKKSPQEAITSLREMMKGNIPSEITISAINQYRVLHPVGEEKVHAIYSIVRTNLEDYKNTYNFEDLSEEELEEEGVKRFGKYFFDSEGRKLVDREDMEYGWWIEKTLLYQDPNSAIRGNNFTYHGTSLSRAKQAFPTLLK